MRGTFSDDERGASIAVTHALTLGITAILITTLLLSTGNFLQSQQERVAQQQLREIGGDAASLVGDADDLNETGTEVRANLSASYPQSVAGEPYTIALVPQSGSAGTNATIYLNASDMDVSIEVPVTTDTEMRQSRMRGSSPTVRLCYDGSDQFIVLGRCS